MAKLRHKKGQEQNHFDKLTFETEKNEGPITEKREETQEDVEAKLKEADRDVCEMMQTPAGQRVIERWENRVMRERFLNLGTEHERSYYLGQHDFIRNLLVIKDAVLKGDKG